ncbi:hypothetical protein ACWHAM_26110 [Paenibacillus terrae]
MTNIQGVSLEPKHENGAIVSYTFEPQFDSPNDIYVSERYYDGKKLVLTFVNPSGLTGTVNVTGWETAPYRGPMDHKC